MNDDFFKKQTQSSRIKANIVAEYFPQYCRILLKKPQAQIRYLDLFSGPGLYEDGNYSTPLLIAEACSKDFGLKKKVKLLFNDNKYAYAPESNFLERFPKGTFEYEPVFASKTVGEDERIASYLMKYNGTPNPYPTLLFFDPWGYKGIDTKILGQFLENWGNELFLFVNIKRIHSAIENDKFDELMLAIFPTLIADLRTQRRYRASVPERLSLIMDNLAAEFKKACKGELYHAAFKFQEEDSTATSHYIVHFTKHRKGFELVKQIYYDFDNIGATLDKDGNYTFDAKQMGSSINSLLFFGDQNIELLSADLEEEFKGKSISAKNLFEAHHPKTKFCGSHYVKTLRNMVEQQRITAVFTDGKPHKVSVLLRPECKLEFKNG